MKAPLFKSASHPSPEYLALYSRGDLPFFLQRRLRLHLAECAECERQVSQVTAAVTELKREAATETLTAFEAIADWNTLEREMIGNIVVGVSAARCIEKVGRRRTWIPRLALGAGLCALFVAGWVTHIPRQQTEHLTASLSKLFGAREPVKLTNVIETTPNGIAVRSQGVTLTILHPGSAVISRSGNSSVAARYVDEDTGQLTINNVYGQ
ncbi:MAG TPA: zf-HC2 domain-containing protein [Bryobacteraceae bacterium]|jgi:hypothetical protein|nr:zf-HC2 domain-containing protein [Bryobacteraceae bacterium]